MAIVSENTPLVSKLFHAFEDSHLDSGAPYQSYLDLANRTVENLQEPEVNTVLSLANDADGNVIGMPATTVPEGDVKFGFINFIATLKDVLQQRQPLFLSFNGLERQEAPSIDVYDYKGHNELNIKKSKMGYARLFDR